MSSKKEKVIKKAQVQVTGTTTDKSAKSNKVGSLVGELFGAIGTTYDEYVKSLTPRLKLIDLFLVFLVALGILQFLYVLLIGNFPFNAFLGGFISCVGQFVLLVSLRLQVKEPQESEEPISDEAEVEDEDEVLNAPAASSNKSIFSDISPERAFGDFLFASLILHFVVYHFIN